MAVFAVGTVGGLTDLGTICLHIASLWPHPPVVVEADPDGGRLAVRHNWNLRPGLGDLIALAQSNTRPTRSGTDPADIADLIDSVAHRLRNGVRVIVSPPSIEAVCSSLSGLAQAMESIERKSAGDVIVDVGIVRPESPARLVMSTAARRVIVIRKEVDDLVALAHRRSLLESVGEWFVLTAGGRLRAEDVEDAIDWPIVADLLPHDRKSSAKLRTALARLAAGRTRSPQPV